MEGLKKLSGKTDRGNAFLLCWEDVIFSFIFNQFEIKYKKICFMIP